MQLWVAQPEATGHADAAFEHHAELPALELDSRTATVLVGELGGTASPARRDTDHFGASLTFSPAGRAVPSTRLRARDRGPRRAALVDDQVVTPGHLAYLGTGRDELAVEATADDRAMLLGGKPVRRRSHVVELRRPDSEEASRAWQDWDSGSHRFGPVDSRLPRIAVGPPPWLHP